MILRNLSYALQEGDFEGRCALISALLLSLSVHLSGFNPHVSAVVILISGFVSRGKNLRLIAAFTPFFVLIILSGLLFSFEYSLMSSLAFAAIISAGVVVYASRISEVAGAMIYFKVPERFVSMIQLGLCVMPVLVNDLQEIMFVMDAKGLRRYENALKAFISTAILRALSLSESLYSKNYRNRCVFMLRSPEKKDITLLSVSFLLFLSTALLNLLSLPF